MFYESRKSIPSSTEQTYSFLNSYDTCNICFNCRLNMSVVLLSFLFKLMSFKIDMKMMISLDTTAML